MSQNNNLPVYSQQGWGAQVNKIIQQLRYKIDSLEAGITAAKAENNMLTKYSSSGLCTTSTLIQVGPSDTSTVSFTDGALTYSFNAETTLYVSVSGGECYFTSTLSNSNGQKVKIDEITENFSFSAGIYSAIIVLEKNSDNALELHSYVNTQSTANFEDYNQTAFLFNSDKIRIGVVTVIGDKCYFICCPYLCTHTDGERYNIINNPIMSVDESGLSSAKFKDIDHPSKYNFMWEGIGYSTLYDENGGIEAQVTNTDFDNITATYDTSITWSKCYIDSSTATGFSSLENDSKDWVTSSVNDYYNSSEGSYGTYYYYRYFLLSSGMILCARESIEGISENVLPINSSEELKTYGFDNGTGSILLAAYKWAGIKEILRATRRLSFSTTEPTLTSSIICTYINQEGSIVDSAYVKSTNDLWPWNNWGLTAYNSTDSNSDKIALYIQPHISTTAPTVVAVVTEESEADSLTCPIITLSNRVNTNPINLGGIVKPGLVIAGKDSDTSYNNILINGLVDSDIHMSAEHKIYIKNEDSSIFGINGASESDYPSGIFAYKTAQSSYIYQSLINGDGFKYSTVQQDSDDETAEKTETIHFQISKDNTFILSKFTYAQGEEIAIPELTATFPIYKILDAESNTELITIDAMSAENPTVTINCPTYFSNGTYYVTSDKRYKENIHCLQLNATELISKLSVYNYNLKTDKKPTIGILAQELQQYYPLLVETVDDSKNDGVSDKLVVAENKLVYLCLKAIQELKEEIDILKSKLEA